MRTKASGFTLAELLIALAILGVIATFTIPKIIGSATSGQNTAIAKEAASMVSGAFSVYSLNNAMASGTTAGQLSQYMNYVSIDATATTYNFGAACNVASIVCLKLHNGGILRYKSDNSFGGVTTTHGIYFEVDPDGAGTQLPTTFIQFYNGRLTTFSNLGGIVVQSTAAEAATTNFADPAYIQNWS